jgi:hypothetical protein
MHMVGLVRHSLNSNSSYVEIHGILFHPGSGLSGSCVSKMGRGVEYFDFVVDTLGL